MIVVKNQDQIAAMRVAGRLTGETLAYAHSLVREGVSTKYLDTKIREFIEKHGAKPSFLGLYGFPASACISVNEEVIHGIPSEKRILTEGDIVSIDVGACYRGFHGDSARTFPVGHVSNEALKLMAVTKQSFMEGAKMAIAQNRVGDIGSRVEAVVKDAGFSVVRNFVGHGVGKDLHEDPEVPNFGTAGRGVRLYPGMTIAIEPMVNVGTHTVETLSNQWTVVTMDRKLSAHYENTVLITMSKQEFLTGEGDSCTKKRKDILYGKGRFD
ncbi:MAG: type I methionyl aminopeptidase [Clostridia bacterium]|nr:type I methionyl aminopeptidase [Clostridia bacterium]